MKYQQFYKHRSVWMGAAIIGVILYHAGIKFQYKAIRNIMAVVYGSVDIFIFASGLGCTYSYRKQGDYFSFIVKRLKRVYPAYLLFMVLWIPYVVIVYDMPIKSVIGNIIGIEYFTLSDRSFNWYFSFIVVLYFFAPFLIETIEKIQDKKHFYILLAFLILLTVPFLGVHSFIIMITRLPIFAIGIYFAVYHHDDDQIKTKNICIWLILIVFGFLLLRFFFVHYPYDLWDYGLYWYPFIMITPGLCFVISWFCEMSQRSKYIDKLIMLVSKTGSISLELYFIHIFFLDIYKHFSPHQTTFGLFTVILLSFPGALLLKRIAGIVLRKAESIRLR